MRTSFAFIASLFSAAILSAQPGPAPDSSIRARIAAFQSAFNKADVAEMVSFYAPDADAAIGDGPLVAGSAALRADGARQLAERPAGLRIAISVLNVRLIAPDVAIANTRAHFNNPAVKDDRGTWVFVRKDGKWLVSAIRVQQAAK